jgi:hypothetical protein
VGVRSMMSSCYRRGTPLYCGWTESKRIEAFRRGDVILTQDEDDPDGPLVLSVVEEVFQRVGRIWRLRVGGRVIETTGEHPHFVARTMRFEPVSALQVGDLLKTGDRGWVAVEEVCDTGEYDTVYNLSVARHHTYFVGCREWGFGVWAHNANQKGCGVASQGAQSGAPSAIHPNNRIPLGNLGEALGKKYLGKKGYKWVGSLKNNSNQGLDGVYLKGGKLYIVDVKTSTASNFHLEKLQKKGPVAYANLQIDRALNEYRQWKAAPSGTKEFATQLRDLLEKYKGKVEGLIVKVPDSGTNPSRIRDTTWTPVTPSTPG